MGKQAPLLPLGLQSPDRHIKHRQEIQNLGRASDISKAARSMKNGAILLANLCWSRVMRPVPPTHWVSHQCHLHAECHQVTCWVSCSQALQVEEQSLSLQWEVPSAMVRTGENAVTGPWGSQRGSASPGAAEQCGATWHPVSQGQTHLPPQQQQRGTKDPPETSSGWW